MSEFKIEKGVEIPNKDSGRKYPYKEMEVGDSFFVEKASVAKLSPLFRDWRRSRPGTDYCSRTVEGGVRIWRTK